MLAVVSVVAVFLASPVTANALALTPTHANFPMSCGACHSAHMAEDKLLMFQSLEDLHAPLASNANCMASGCHSGDLSDIHADTVASIGGTETASCRLCHVGDEVPPTRDCLDCHASKQDTGGNVVPHGFDPVRHTATLSSAIVAIDGKSFGPLECTGCHDAQVQAEHVKPSSASAAAGCGSCHPTAVASLSPAWEKGCVQGGCHAAGTPVAQHASIDASHSPLPGETCYAAGCHAAAAIQSLAETHRDATATIAGQAVSSCGVCHASGVPATKGCTECHGPVPHKSHPGTTSDCRSCHAVASHPVATVWCEDCHGAYHNTADYCDDCHSVPTHGAEVLVAVPCMRCHVPAAPTISAVPGDAAARLSWTPMRAAGSYELQRALDSGFTLDATTLYSGVTTSFLNVALSNGTGYYYRVRTTETNGFVGTWSAPLLVTPSATPVAPAVSATPRDAGAQLSWTSIPGALAYEVQQSTLPSFPAGSTSQAYTGAGASASIAGLANGTTYYYRARAIGTGGTGPWSAVTSVRPLPPLAAAPTPRALAGDGQVSLSWAAVPGTISYTVQRATNAAFTSGRKDTAIAVPATFTVDAGLVNGTAYYYRMTVRNLAGTGAPGVAATATPSNPTATLSQPSVTYAGAAGFDFAWQGGTSPYVVVVDGTAVAQADSTSYRYPTPLPGSHSVYVRDAAGARSLATAFSQPFFLGDRFFRSDAATVNGLSVLSLGRSPSGVGGSLALIAGEYHSIRVLRRSSAGIETVVSDWQQATEYYSFGDDAYHYAALTTAWRFPGWTGGSPGDSLVMDVGLASSPYGLPGAVARFTTEALGVTSLPAQDWTVTRDVSFDSYEWLGSETFGGHTGFTVYEPSVPVPATPLSELLAVPSGGNFLLGWNGGTAPYTVLLDGNDLATVPSSGYTYVPPGPGTHHLAIRDAVGTVGPSVSLTTWASLTGPTVTPAGSGFLLDWAGGKPPYAVSVDSSQTATVTGTSWAFSPTAAGTYAVSVRDSLGATVTATVVKSETPPLSALTVTPAGSSWDLSWTGGEGPFTVIANGTAVGTVATRSYRYSAPDAGSWTVRVRDARGEDGSATVLVRQWPDPTTLYFDGTPKTVGSLSGFSLNRSLPSAFGGLNVGTANPVLYVATRTLRLKADGTLLPLTGWLGTVAEGYDPSRYINTYPEADYAFPGWTAGDTADRLVVEVGIGPVPGNPSGTQRFITGTVGVVSLRSETWHLSYTVFNGNSPDDGQDYAEFVYGVPGAYSSIAGVTGYWPGTTGILSLRQVAPVRGDAWWGAGLSGSGPAASPEEKQPPVAEPPAVDASSAPTATP